ncbi:MAG: lytic transglycosylase domain-containing protein [Rhodobacterales bacterium]|nr:lytic transglycosylase domain-containing protein [Rhodobacterales bacterium]
MFYAKALAAAGEAGEADATVVLAWRSFQLGKTEHARFIAEYGKLLAPHHQARLEMALWRGLKSDVDRMLPLLPAEWAKLVEARRALRAGKSEASALIEALPETVAQDAGLAFARFVWRLRKGKTASAIELILARSAAETLGQPEKWASRRRSLARAQMRQGNSETAYAIATKHGLVEGSNYADLEWLAGYLALRKLNDPALALIHFQNFEAAVFTPISLGRAGYWIGVTQTALGDTAAASAAFRQGTQHQTSFYGLLAAERAGVVIDAKLAGDEKFPPWQEAAFAQSDVFRAAIIAHGAQLPSIARRFFLQVAETQDRIGLGQLGQMAIDLGSPNIAVMIGKQAAKRGIVLPAPYYPLHPLHELDLPVPDEFALAIARRESQFDPVVVSGAGAQGLMQLMPATAKAVARGLGVEHNAADVLGDWRYNARLGSAYLEEVGRRFNGNVIMVSAGYNAGPGRPAKWMEAYGDPRRGDIDIVDWIEHIPFRETRNYVMRVAESLPVYRARLGRKALPVPFSAELVGRSIP